MRRVVLMLLVAGLVGLAEEPALPPGLGGTPKPAEPGLPPGLSGATKTDEPALPPGLGTSSTSETRAQRAKLSLRDRLPFEVAGFLDARAGWRTQVDDGSDTSQTLGETRLQLEADKRWERAAAKVVADFLYDGVADDHSVDLTRGEGWFDLRQANVSFTPVDFMDVKVGRQILTWGTGDLLFINDNFPKDWVSFFIGRDVEYLKAPSDAAKVSFFSDVANLDLVYTPQFDPDRYITGQRISYWNAGLGRRAGDDGIAATDVPDRWFDDDEIAARLYRNVNGYEMALYGYDGYWKSPAGQNMSGQATFPRLGVYGASVRGKALGGIGNAEIGYYDSRDDRAGDDPMVRNSEWRALVGYERDLSFIAPDFTLGLQWYLEHMQNHGEYLDTLPAGMPAKDQDRHVATIRLTKQLMQQNLVLSFFAYWSPTDHDAYLRPSASYKLSDAWEVSAGGNFFLGEDSYTFFDQFAANNNLWVALRCSF